MRNLASALLLIVSSVPALAVGLPNAPEPSSVALIGAAVVAVALLRRRTK